MILSFRIWGYFPPFHDSAILSFRIWDDFPPFRDSAIPPFRHSVIPSFRLLGSPPVYCRQTGFSSTSSNFYEKPMVETEPTEKHGGEITGRLYSRDICVWPGFETVS